MENKKLQQTLLINGVLLLIVIVWMIPTIGLFVSSFRERFDIQTTGWWTIFPHRAWAVVEELDPTTLELNPDEPMEIKGITGTFDEFREGISSGDNLRILWIGNKRIGRIEVQEQVWTVNLDFTSRITARSCRGKISNTNVQMARLKSSRVTISLARY